MFVIVTNYIPRVFSQILLLKEKQGILYQIFTKFMILQNKQWQIQDFQGAPTPKVGVKSYNFILFYPENCIKMKEIRLRGAPTIPRPAPVEPPGINFMFYKNGLLLLKVP